MEQMPLDPVIQQHPQQSCWSERDADVDEQSETTGVFANRTFDHGRHSGSVEAKHGQNGSALDDDHESALTDQAGFAPIETQ